MASFDVAYNKTVVGNEGGYRNFSWDAETYRGINRNAHPSWQGWALIDQRKPIPYNTVFPDLEPLVKQFYTTNFWASMYGSFMQSQALANLIFDYYVQTGPYAIKKVQQAVNTVAPSRIAVDGVMGNDTLTAINLSNEAKLNNTLLDIRKAHYLSLYQGGTFSANDWQGVLNRLNSFPYLKETLLGAGIIALLLVTFVVVKMV